MNQATAKFVYYLLTEEGLKEEVKTWVNHCLHCYDDYDVIFREIYDYFGDSWFEDAPFSPEVLEQIDIGETVRMLVEYFENDLTLWEISFLKKCA